LDLNLESKADAQKGELSFSQTKLKRLQFYELGRYLVEIENLDREKC